MRALRLGAGEAAASRASTRSGAPARASAARAASRALAHAGTSGVAARRVSGMGGADDVATE
jgi:hypothetical protein